MRKYSESIMKIVFLVTACVSIIAVILICVFLFASGVPAIKEIGFTDFLFGTSWKPGQDLYGIFPMIIGSVYVTAGAIIIGVPIGLLCAVFMARYCPKGLYKVLKPAVDLLAGIPSIIYGLFGMMFFGQTLKMGYSLLTGSFTLSLMILPLIVRNTQESLKTVPDSYRQGAIGLGAGKWYMIRTILIPCSLPGIITGVILSVGRIVGESAALLFTAGSAKILPKSIKGFFSKIFHSGGTMTIQLYLSATADGDFQTAFGIAFVLIVIVFGINILTKVLAKKFDNTKG